LRGGGSQRYEEISNLGCMLWPAFGEHGAKYEATACQPGKCSLVSHFSDRKPNRSLDNHLLFLLLLLLLLLLLHLLESPSSLRGGSSNLSVVPA